MKQTQIRDEGKRNYKVTAERLNWPRCFFKTVVEVEEAEVEQFGVEREREVKGGVLMTDVRDDLNKNMKIVTVLEEEEEEAERESAGLLW